MVELKEINPKAIAIATTTFYPDWRPSQMDRSVVSVRGEIAIGFVHEVVSRGYQIIVIDGGSSDDFRPKIAEFGVSIQPEQQRGMSASRRQSYREASNLPGVQVICWTEPEKVSFVRDCLPQAAAPILNDSADIVVPKREEAALATYPDYQVDFEMRSNNLWNAILRARHLLPGDVEGIDICFGPKLFRNDPDIVELFMRRFKLLNVSRALDKILDPELWHGAVTFPVITALHEGKRVVNIEVPYRHPMEQTEVEIDSDELRRKRDIQYKNLIVLTIQYAKLLKDAPFKSRIVRITEEGIQG